MIAAIKVNGVITQYIEDCEEIPEGFIEVTKKDIVALKNKNEIETIEQALRLALPRYNELKELGEMRSEQENIEFGEMETKKIQLMERRKYSLS